MINSGMAWRKIKGIGEGSRMHVRLMAEAKMMDDVGKAWRKIKGIGEGSLMQVVRWLRSICR